MRNSYIKIFALLFILSACIVELCRNFPDPKDTGTSVDKIPVIYKIEAAPPKTSKDTCIASMAGEANAALSPEDKRLPDLYLEGGDRIQCSCGIPFIDPGYRATGSDGEDLTDRVVVEGSVKTWLPGDYCLVYTAEDKDGKTFQARRTVTVVPTELPETVTVDKAIYLTFDDGPSEYTGEVLDILDKYDAKATFFIVAGSNKYIDILKEVADRGHTVGIHAYSHNSYDRLYSGEEVFFEDFMKAQQVIFEHTGSYASISRFPGGSRTASFLAGTMADTIDEGYIRLNEIMHNMGVRYYDWSVQPESGTRDTGGTVTNFCNEVPELEGPICLQHDTRVYSVRALEQMLKWGTENGYSFLAMDNTVPEHHFR